MISTLKVCSARHVTCQDSLYVNTATEDVISGGIFDGCSQGIESQWASQTLAYLFCKFEDPTTTFCAKQALLALEELKKMLGLSTGNLESTCLLFHYYIPLQRLRVRSFGDGCYYVNDIEVEIDQKNEPDYLCHYINRSTCDQEEYFKKYPVNTFHDVDKFILCSDGIKQIEIPQLSNTNPEEPNKLLLHPPANKTYLGRMWNILSRKKVIAGDDISIISYVRD